MRAEFSFEGRLLLETRPMDRSSVRILRDGKKARVIVEAADAVAFRAACNAVLREIVVREAARSLSPVGLCPPRKI